MADKLIFPVGFDLDKAIKDAEKEGVAGIDRLSRAFSQRALEIKIKTNISEIENVGRNMNNLISEVRSSIDTLTATLTRLNGLLANSGNDAAAAQQKLTTAIEEQGGAVANTTNTISRQLMEQERVNQALRETYNEQEKVNRLLSQYHDTYENQVESLARLKSQLEANKKAQSDNKKALEQHRISAAQYATTNAELLAQQRQLTAEKRALTQIMTAEEKAMMAQEGSYKHLSQQLSLLKSAYKELGDESRVSPFGQELEAAIQNLDARLKDMAADMGEFQRNVGNYAIAGQNGVVTTESLTAAINQEARTTQDLIDQTRILEEAKRMLNKEDANYESTLSALNSRLEENRRKLADVSDILGREAKTVTEAEAQNKRLSEALKHIDLTSADAKKQLEALRAQIERNNRTINAATGANEKYAESVLGLVGVNANFGRSLQGLGQGGNFIDGVKIKVQALGKTLMGLLANPYVLAILGIAGVVAGFKWWYDYNKGLIEASRLTENFTGLSGEAADKVTADMQALADHMGKGYKETISAANMLVQQFGVSWADAMKLMQDGITAGADMSGNMVSNIEKFAPALRDAGVSADEFMSILAETRNGIFNEQGIQHILRGGTRLRSMTKQISESLDAVGISSQKMQKDLSDGTITMFDAVQMVAAKLKELPENSQEAGNIMKHVFGRTAAEGGTLLIQSIADVNTNLDEAKERMGELGKANEAQMNAQRELNEALSAVFKMSGSSFEVMTTNAKTFLIQGLTKIIGGCVEIVNWFIRMYNKSLVVRGAVSSIVNSFQMLWEIGKFVLNQLVDSFAAAGTVIEGVVTLDWDKVKEGWSRGMNALGHNLKTLASNMAKNTANAFDNTFNGEMKELSVGLNGDISNTNATNKTDKADKKENKIQPIDTANKEAAKSYLQTLNKIEQSISAINSKYNELAKKEGNIKALEHINDIYKGQLDYINELGRQFGLAFKMPTSFKQIQEYRAAILDVVNQLKSSGVEGAKSAALELEMKIGLGDVDKLRKEIERKLKTMTDKVSRTNIAKDFYNKILNQTGSQSLAVNVTTSIYGTTGQDLEKQIVEQIQEYFSGVDVKLPINFTTGDVDYKALREIWESDKALPEEMRKIPQEYDSAIKAIIDNGDAMSRAQAERWLADLDTAKGYSDKRIQLAQYTANQIEEIERKREALDPGSKDYETKRQMYDDMINGYRQRESKQADELDFEAFKEMPMYVQMFSDLDHASTTMLNNMRDKLTQMQGAWENLSPTQLKELQSRLNEIDAQLAQRNPFKTLGNAFKEYKELRKDGTKADADKGLREATDKYIEARQNLEKVLEENPNDEEAVNNARQLVKSTEEAQREAEKLAERWANVEKAIGLSSNEIFGILGSLSDVAAGIGKLTQVFGGDEEDVQYWNDIADGLSEVTSGIENMVQAAMSGNPIGIVTSALTAIPNMISGFAGLFSAGKVRRANKEIKRQQKILEQLEYTYSRLQNAADKLFGADYTSNYNQQMKVLQARQQALLKQAEAERSKGKKEDKAKTEEYLNQARDVTDQIADMEKELTAHFTGTSRQDAAREFARSWLEAKTTFASTTDAIKSKYKDMLKSMVVEGAMAKIVDNALAPLWEQMDKAYAANDPMRAIEIFAKGFNQFVADADNGLQVMWNALEARGIEMNKILGDSGKGYTGIAREIAIASEESINGLAAGVNTQNFYIAQINANVAAIAQNMGVNGKGGVSTIGIDYTPMLQQSLENQSMMIRYQAEAVSECRDIAAKLTSQLSAVTEIRDNLRRTITPRGTKASHVINTILQ